MDDPKAIIPSEVKNHAINDFDINSGSIFSDLLKDWKNFNREYLQTDIQKAIQSVLLKNGVVTYKRKEGKDEYFARVSKEYFDFKAEQTSFPFPTYFISSDRLIEYSEPVILSRGDNFFDLFLALKLRLIDPIQIRAFLSYHLITSFGDNKPMFNSYLHDLLLSYGFFTPAVTSIVEDYLYKNMNPNKETFDRESPTENDDEDLKECTTQRQCLAIYYLLIAAGIIDKKTGEVVGERTKADILKLIAFLTKKNESNVKKAYNTMLGKGSEKAYYENLEFIRPYFEKLQLQNAVEQINAALKGVTP